ncbi:serine/threonine protein kinase [Micromonospora globispora]|uniref:non-specific serine/threonine protein kinase n=1 Tax=Micromonospora globispora TaxID=1450148 RepID=A0A317K4R8_9ACTN|nr:serine/threonine-protein kinase [Micromonospora globispora]PWU48059.1 serine/threonine protein kinase [Micromonospora globispora]PWU58856.1 serine/threonine protein kinase [Micromonospora globispora]
MQARDRIGDRYELTYPIGRGGMGQVWAGYDERLDRPVAVKFLRQMDVPEDEREVAVKRFRREARVTARLDHSGVPVVHDLGEHGQDLYIVMQLVPGVVLADLIAEQEELPVGQAASIAAQVCSVLAAAHDASLVHRDLKPQNVMITPTGVVKVLDFGVTALLGPAEMSRLTATGRTLGTPAYIAPEQASAEPVGPAADLYGLGCILFEMLAGKPPYEAKNAPDMLRRHMQSPVPIITEYRSDVPDDLAHLLFCLLAKNPTDRPASATEVEQLLMPFLDETSGPAARMWGRATEVSDPAWKPTVAPAPPLAQNQELAEYRERAQELAENERFLQAAEVLEHALRSAQSDRPLDPQIIVLRVDLANLRMLAGDYRGAQHDFEELAQDLSGPGGDAELAQHCRQQALACMVELAGASHAGNPSLTG